MVNPSLGVGSKMTPEHLYNWRIEAIPPLPVGGPLKLTFCTITQSLTFANFFHIILGQPFSATTEPGFRVEFYQKTSTHPYIYPLLKGSTSEIDFLHNYSTFLFYTSPSREWAPKMEYLHNYTIFDLCQLFPQHKWPVHFQPHHSQW